MGSSSIDTDRHDNLKFVVIMPKRLADGLNGAVTLGLSTQCR